MRKILLTNTAFIAAIAASSVFAHEQAVEWTGFYAGLNAGYLWSNNSVDTTTTNVSAIPLLNGDIAGAVAEQGTGNVSTDHESFIGGVQIGYNQQYREYFVLGIEADIQGLTSPTSESSIMNSGFVDGANFDAVSTGLIESSESLDYLGTVRGRMGVLAMPNLLTYVTGGLAYGGVRTSTTITETLGFSDTLEPFGTSGNFSDTEFGWTAGAGLEWMFIQNLSAKLEYLYYDLGSVNNQLPQILQYGHNGTSLETVSDANSTARFNGNTMRAGINYIFS